MRPTEILLVDDNPADTDLTSEVLSRNGCPSHIHAVTDGVEAIAFLRREGKYANARLPDLVILDLNLPKKDGRAAVPETIRITLLMSLAFLADYSQYGESGSWNSPNNSIRRSKPHSGAESPAVSSWLCS